MAKRERQSVEERAAEMITEQIRQQAIMSAKMVELGMTAPAPRKPVCSFDATLSPGGRITIPLPTMKMAQLTPGMILRVEITNFMRPEADMPATPLGDEGIVEVGKKAEARGKLRQLIAAISELDLNQRDALMPIREVIIDYIKILGRSETGEQEITKILDDYEKRLRPEVERIALTDKYGKRLTQPEQKEAKRKK